VFLQSVRAAHKPQQLGLGKVCLIEEKEKLVFNQELSSDTHFKVI
jgi:hypothetical protein